MQIMAICRDIHVIDTMIYCIISAKSIFSYPLFPFFHPSLDAMLCIYPHHAAVKKKRQLKPAEEPDLIRTKVTLHKVISGE